MYMATGNSEHHKKYIKFSNEIPSPTRKTTIINDQQVSIYKSYRHLFPFIGESEHLFSKMNAMNEQRITT